MCLHLQSSLVTSVFDNKCLYSNVSLLNSVFDKMCLDLKVSMFKGIDLSFLIKIVFDQIQFLLTRIKCFYKPKSLKEFLKLCVEI